MTKYLALALAAALALPAHAGKTIYDGGIVASFDAAKDRITLDDGRFFDLPRGSDVDAGDVGSYVRILFDQDGDDAMVVTSIETRS